jgi:hypothetical protein
MLVIDLNMRRVLVEIESDTVPRIGESITLNDEEGYRRVVAVNYSYGSLSDVQVRVMVEDRVTK